MRSTNTNQNSTYSPTAGAAPTDYIYTEEFKRSIQTQKRFREIWMEFDAPWNHELFQYANEDFYFYRFNIDRKERSTTDLLKRIIFRLLELYHCTWNTCNSPLLFKITRPEGTTFAYTFEDFYEDEDIAEICKDNAVDKIYIIRTWKGDRTTEWINNENKQYASNHQPICAISIGSFFTEIFGAKEYQRFELHLAQYLEQIYDLVGYRSIKFLSSMNLATQKLVLEKKIIEYASSKIQYAIIDRHKDAVQQFLYVDGYSIPDSMATYIQANYIKNGVYKALLGCSEFAESFVTSEWLYHSLEGTNHFDYTSIVSGYLKSVEQLLLQLVLINVGNNCKITLKGNKRKDAKNAGIRRYTLSGGRFRLIEIDRIFDREYIDLTTPQLEYMDSDLGTFEYFLRNNPHIFHLPFQQVSSINNKTYCAIIADIVSCFRAECRNGYFHTHNLHDWDTVKKIRDNAYMIYALLLGSCVIPKHKYNELKIPRHDWFDILGIKLNNNRRRTLDYIFEYSDGRSECVVFDWLNNSKEYTDSGIERYDSLLFLRVPDFSIASYEALDANISEAHRVALTREFIPYRIWSVDRKNQKTLVFDASTPITNE